MATSYQIRTQFLLEDKASKALESLGLKGSFVGKTLSASLLQAEERWNALGAVAKKAAIGLAAASTAALGAGIVTATQRYIAFDDALSAAGAHFGDLDVSAEDYQSHLEDLKKAALEVSGATRFNATDTAGALDKMAMAGFTSAQSMAMLAGTANMATAAGVDLTSGVDMVTDAMGAFQLTKDELGRPLSTEKLQQNLAEMGDVVSLATKKANFDMNMWFESVKTGAPVFSSYGGSLADFTAMAGTLANVGIKGGEAGTALRNVMQRLATPTDTASDALKSLGISIYDSSGKMLPLLDILRQFENSIGTLPDMAGYMKALEEAGGDESKVDLNKFLGDGFDKDKLANLNDIFGQRAITSFLVLLNEGSESIGKFSAELAGAKGAAESTANAMNQSLGARIAILQSSLETLGIKFVDALKPQAAPLIDSLTSAVEQFTKNTLPSIIQAVQTAVPYIQKIFQTIIDHLPEALAALANLMPMFKLITMAISGIFSIVWALKTPLTIILGLWGSWQVAMMVLSPVIKAVTAVQSAYNLVMGIAKGVMIAHQAAVYGTTVAVEAQNAATLGATIGMKLYSAGTGIVTAAQWLWNTAIMACPIAWIIAGIIALVGIIVVLAGKWEAVSGAVDGFFKKIHEMDGLGGWILQTLLTPFELVWNVVRGLFDVINAFKVGGFIAGLKMIGLSILQMLVAPIESLLQVISFIPGLGSLKDKLHGWFDNQRAGIIGAAEQKAENTSENVKYKSKKTGIFGAVKQKAEVMPENAVMFEKPIGINDQSSEKTMSENPIIMQTPTQTAAAANSYSRQEITSTSNVNINLSDRLQADDYGMVAPGVTVQRTYSGAL